jgi:plastocyanin
MIRTRTTLLLALAVSLIAASAATAGAGSTNASVQIRHQVRGCHAWSVDGGVFKASQSVKLRHGARLTVTNNDVMPHTFLRTGGPAVRIPHATLGHMGASVTITLTRPGTYRFTTKAGEDYPGMNGLKTIGEDNVLRLTVVVS